MLWLAMLVRDTGIPASERLGITDKAEALDFDLAVTHRLDQYRLEENRDQAKRIAYHAALMFFGSGDDEGEIEEVQDATARALIADDPFADKNTEVW